MNGAAAMLATLQRLRDAGWLRPLDLALARLLFELDPDIPASLLGAAALLTQLEGQGHGCLPLAALRAQPLRLLGWPDAAGAELGVLLRDLPDAAAAAWAASPMIAIVPGTAAEPAATPLVLHQGRLYLRRYWRHDVRVAAQVRQRARADEADAADLDPARADALLDLLFDAPGVASGPDLQKAACALALRGRLTIITGGPGTGKTYTAARLLVLLQTLHNGTRPLRVALAAPTGKAAARLRQSIELALQGLRRQLGARLPQRDDWAAHLGPARTLHALLGTRPGRRRFEHDAGQPLDVDLLFVDEGSMVHLEMMDALLDALPTAARLVLLGDPDQLASVEAGAVLGDLCQGPVLADRIATLSASRRFAGAIGRLAQAVNRGDGAAAIDLLQAGGEGDLALVPARDAQPVADLALAGYRPCLEALARRPAESEGFEPWAREVLRRFDDFRVLCALREGPFGVAGLNATIERALVGAGLLQRRGEWYEGRPVMVMRNDAALGVYNGDVGLVLRPPGSTDPGGPLRACFLDGETLRTVSVTRLAEVQTAFALTVHKSQGSEFGQVVLVLPDEDSPLLTRELLYTGITRARQRLTLVADDPQRVAAACARLTQRLSGLRALL